MDQAKGWVQTCLHSMSYRRCEAWPSRTEEMGQDRHRLQIHQEALNMIYEGPELGTQSA